MRAIVFCWEAGSAGALIPVIRRAIENGWQVLDVSLEPGRSILARAVPELACVERGDHWIGWGEVVLAGLGHPKHKLGWAKWLQLKTAYPTLVLLDHWKGLARFFHSDGGVNVDAMPDKLCVIDAFVKEQICQMGVAPGLVEVVGNMACYAIKNALSAEKSASVPAHFGDMVARSLHFLASETIHDHGFHDECGEGCHPLEQHLLTSGQTVLDWAAAQASGCGAQLLLRPHPNQVFQRPSSPETNVVRWDTATDNQILLSAQRIYGLSSMINAKAVSAGVETVNVAALLKDWSPEQVFISKAQWDELVRCRVLDNTLAGKCDQGGEIADPELVLRLLCAIGK